MNISKLVSDQSRFRSVDHPTDHENCPTRKYYESKWKRHQSFSAIKQPIEDSFRQVGRDGNENDEVTLSGENLDSTSTLDKRGVLVVPKSAGFDVCNALAEIIRSNNDEFASVKIISKTLFPSGAVLFLCDSEDEANRLREIVAKSETLKIKSRSSYKRKVRIDDLPEDFSALEISREIHRKYDETSDKIQFAINWRSPKPERAAVIEVGNSLLKKMEASPEIQIRETPFKIDTAIRLDRCVRCQLLGHVSKNCRETPRKRYTSVEPCVDCSHHNRQVFEAGRGRIIENVNHPTDDDMCPTKIYYLAKIRKHLSNPAEEESEGKSSDENFITIKDGETEDDAKETTYWNDFEQAIEKPAANRFSVLILPKIEGIDVFCELQELNVDAKKSTVENVIVFPSGPILLECRTGKGAEYVQNMIAKSKKLEIVP
jgi:hypothetical protein